MKTLTQQDWEIIDEENEQKINIVYEKNGVMIYTKDKNTIHLSKQAYFDLKNIMESTKFIFSDKNK